MDAVLDVDWATHWRTLVADREAQTGRSESDDWWAPRARQFARQLPARDDWFTAFLEPWLAPAATIIDVGAGTGRYASQFARRVDWVTAVEPSQSMRELIQPADNMTVIASTWEDAEPAAADLVICVHVLYPIAEPVPFLEKLERSARERVFVVLRDAPNAMPAEAMARPGRVREPWLRDCLLLLREMGVEPAMSLATYASTFRYDSFEAAVEQCRSHLGRAWDEARGRGWLEANLRPAEDGTLVYEADHITSGVLHWKPRA